MSELRGIVRNLLSGWMAIGVSFATGLIMVPILIKSIGPNMYGIVALLGAILGLSSLVDLGLRNALGRELSECRAADDPERYLGVASTATIIYMVIAMCIIIFLNTFTNQIVVFFGVDSLDISSVVPIVRVYGSLSTLGAFLIPTYNAALISYKRYDAINKIIVTIGILKNIVMYFLIIHLKMGIWGWVLAQIGGQIFVIYLTRKRVHKLCSMFGLSLKSVKPNSILPLMKLGGYIYTIQLTQTIAEKADPLLISRFFGPTGVALYNPAKKVTNGIRPIVLTLVTQLYPRATEHYVNGNERGLTRLLIEGTKYTLLMGIPISVGLLIYAEPFCKLWLSSALGAEYKIVAILMMGWSLIDITTYSGGSQWSVLLAMKKLKFIVRLLVVTSAINIIVSIYMLANTHYGIPGVLFATIVIGLIQRPILTIHTARACHCKVKRYLKESYLRPLVSGIVVTIALFGVRSTMATDTWLALALSGIISGIVALAITWTTGLCQEDRNNITNIISQIIRARKPS
jgi:O-antigen/teichoic acid export membrane protein